MDSCKWEQTSLIVNVLENVDMHSVSVNRFVLKEEFKVSRRLPTSSLRCCLQRFAFVYDCA